MFRSLLVPLDGPARATTIAYAAGLARAFGASITLLGVKETARDGHAHPVDPFEWHVELSRLLARLEHQAEGLRAGGLEVNTAVREGPASERVPEYAERHGADLVVLTRGWKGPDEDSPLRSLLHAGRQSLLVLPPNAPQRGEQASFRRILIPLDGSRRAECVLPIARALQRGAGSHLLLAHVVEEPRMPGNVPPSAADMRLVRSVVERNRHAASAVLERVREVLGAGAELRVLVNPSIPSALHDLVAGEAADLIVLSAHGSAGDLRWGCGSVAHHLIEYGDHPVLLVQDHRVPVELPARRAPVSV
jgi:nucleotide-binding universal stress UspA family protein